MATCLWLTGRAGSGKSAIARAAVEQLGSTGVAVVLLDEDVRRHLVDGLDSIAWLARILTDGGVTVVVASDLPARDDREHVREVVGRFAEVFIDGGDAAPDDEAYEEPFAPELRVPTHDRDVAASVAQLLSWIEDTRVLAADS